MYCYFVSDLHGKTKLYEKLVTEAIKEKPDAVFIGGDVTPNSFNNSSAEVFFCDFLAGLLRKLKDSNKDRTEVLIIPGNDDPADYDVYLKKLEQKNLLRYLHGTHIKYKGYDLFGYSFVPPTPFLLKDWEKYDVSRYVDPGCVSPEEGYRTVDVPENIIKYSTISEDLNLLAGGKDLRRSIFLFHTPPHKTNLDRAANDGKMYEHVPLELNVGSIAVRKFIEKQQPLITLHGHIHESARLTGSWKDKIGETYCFSAAHDGNGLAIVKFDTANPADAIRELI